MGKINRVINRFKICSKCGTNVSINNYYKNKRNPSGIGSLCKDCCKRIDATRNPLRIYTKEWKANNRESRLKRLYGINQAVFEKMFEIQGKCCAICKTEVPNCNNWHIDHDHETNLVRGILCKNCNIMLGEAKDNPDILRRAAQYLDMQFVV